MLVGRRSFPLGKVTIQGQAAIDFGRVLGGPIFHFHDYARKGTWMIPWVSKWLGMFVCFSLTITVYRCYIDRRSFEKESRDNFWDPYKNATTDRKQVTNLEFQSAYQSSIFGIPGISILGYVLWRSKKVINNEVQTESFEHAKYVEWTKSGQPANNIP